MSSRAADLPPWFPFRERLQTLGQVPVPVAARLAVAVIGPVVAYHYSLLTLLRSLNVETPLAYLGLVPLIALGLMATRARPAANELSIHDRQLDYIIGVPLLLGALALELLLPIRLSTMFWVWRIDLLSFPLLVAGTVTILFGTRALWRLRLPILFLLLAWPLPYSMALVRWLDAFTSTTLWGLRTALHTIPVAQPAAGSDGSLFLVSHATKQFQVSVASACSGVNGIVGYLLISAAFLSVVAGRLRNKLLWLGSGMLFLWVLNVVRILLIFAAGHQWGETVAIDGLHPFIGLVTFNIGVLAMVVVLRHFHLELRLDRRSAAVRRVSPPPGPPRRKAVPHWRLACAVVIAAALCSGVANASLQSYDLVASALGAPRLASFLTDPAHPEGWVVNKADEYTWARRFFGEDSRWIRYRYSFTGDKSAPLQAGSSIISDVIETSDLGSFSTYGLEACYRFHGYTLKAERSVDLGGGIVGSVLSYYNTKTKSDWTTVYWHWPVQTPKGTRYERVTLMLINSASTTLTAPTPAPSMARAIGLRLQNALGEKEPNKADQRLANTRAFLVAFAADVIQHQQPASPSAAPAN